MVVTEQRKDFLVVEHARVMFKLSEALQQEPRYEMEAGDLRAEAERLLRLRHPHVEEAGKEGKYDELVYIGWR